MHEITQINEATARCNRGGQYLNEGNLMGAISECGEALRLNPNLADAYIIRGMARQALDDTDGAIQDFGEAIRLQPTNADVYYSRGVALDNKGERKKAAADYQVVLNLEPDYPEGQAMRNYIEETSRKR